MAPTVEITTFIRTLYGPDGPVKWQREQPRRVRVGDIEFLGVHVMNIRRSDEFELEHPTVEISLYPRGTDNTETVQPYAVIKNVSNIHYKTQEIP